MKTEIKTAIIFGMVIVTVIGILSITFSSLDTELESMDKSSFKMAPDIVGIAHYLNTTPEELEENMKDKVVLYDIWTYSCINCIRTLPHITAWNDKYADEGLLIIGIHSPEFEFEKNLKNVEMAVQKHGIIYPVVMDNDWETWKAFENRYWPRKYIADHEGFIRYDHIGEGAYNETEMVIQKLLKERNTSLGLQTNTQSLTNIEEFEHTAFRTPELYFGYKFAHGRNHLGSVEGFNPNKIITYEEPKDIQSNKFYPIGTWRNTPDSMKLESDTGIIKLSYTAKQVNIVTANRADIDIFLDGKPLPTLSVSEPGLYNIINDDESSSHLLELYISGKDFEIFTFTFG